jgi:puromycin-sensitive aminopeptidase
MDSWIFQAGHPVVTVETDGSTVSMHREMFSFRADPASGVRSPAVSSHQVPVLIRTATGAQHTVQRVLLDDEATVDLPGSPDWIVANHGGHGFYRVALSDHDLHRVVAHAATSLSPLERYGLVEDEWALLLSGQGSLDRVLTVVRALAGDPDLSVCQRVVGVLGSLDRLVPSSAADGYASFCRGLISPALVASGPEPVTGESERTTARRATLFDASARFGRDRAQLDLARERFALLGSPSGAPTLGPDLADAVVRVVASTANRDTWNELRRRAQSSTTPQDRLRHQGALADSADPDLVVELAALTLSDEIRTQDGPFILRRALSNRHAHQQVWAFVEDRWDEIAARFPSTTVPRLLDGVRPVTDRALASTHRIAFLADHPLAQGEQGRPPAPRAHVGDRGPGRSRDGRSAGAASHVGETSHPLSRSSLSRTPRPNWSGEAFDRASSPLASTRGPTGGHSKPISMPGHPGWDRGASTACRPGTAWWSSRSRAPRWATSAEILSHPHAWTACPGQELGRIGHGRAIST